MINVIIRALVSIVALAAMCFCCIASSVAAEPVRTVPVVQTVVQQEAAPEPAAAPKSSVTAITKIVKLTEDLTIEKGDTIYVKSGGILYVDQGACLTVNGKLKVAEGGELYVKGGIDIRPDALVSISGKAKILKAGNVTLGGELWVNPTGIVKGNGRLAVLNKFSDIKCRGSFTAKIKAPKPVEIDGVTYVGGILIVNKKYGLPQTYGDGISSEAYSAFVKMKKASGYDMEIISGFRSYEKQKNTFEYWCSIDGEEVASTYSARPGHSEHQTGLAMDITSLEQAYGKTEEGMWLAQNCHEYGFIIRYPKNKTKITGYMYEPWHVRYLGKSTAKLVHDSGLSLEEFLGVA